MYHPQQPHHINDEYKEITSLAQSSIQTCNDAILDDADDNDAQAMLEWERSMAEEVIGVHL